MRGSAPVNPLQRLRSIKVKFSVVIVAAVAVTLAVNEMMGSEYHLHVITKDEQTIILRTPTVDLSEKQRASLKAGNKLRFSFPSKVIQLFDPKSEQSLLYT